MAGVLPYEAFISKDDSEAEANNTCGTGGGWPSYAASATPHTKDTDQELLMLPDKDSICE